LRRGARGQGHIKAEIYAVELIGDHTLVTVKTGSDMLTVKAPKDFNGSIGENIGVSFVKDRLFVFDASNGVRIR
jgi:multiple sugar transport system ATP-binding protein